MAKILLIKCNEFVYPNAATPPLGLMYLSSTLKKTDRHEVRIVDPRPGKRMSPSDIAAEAALFKPDVVGLSAMLFAAKNFHEIVVAVKKVLPSVPVIGGGPYISSCPDWALADGNLLCGVHGEGEATFTHIIDVLKKGERIDDVPGIVYVDHSGGIAKSPPREYIQDVDSIPFPDWDAVDIQGYSKERRFSNNPPAPYMPVFTSRACPFNCIYCHNIFGKKYRSRSPENVLSELVTLNARFGISEFELVDDTFNHDKKRAMTILEAIPKAINNPHLLFPNGIRGDMMDNELAIAMAKAGVRYLAVAIESASPRMQKFVKKNLNIEKARKAIGDLTRAGILCHGFFMLGFPTETEEEVRSTVEFARRSRLHTASFFIVTPAPGTELFDMCSSRKDDNSGEKTFSYHQIDYNCSEVSSERLKKLYREAFLRFYMNPIRLARIFMVFPRKAFLLLSFVHLIERITSKIRVFPQA